jgi:hypothetical protein
MSVITLPSRKIRLRDFKPDFPVRAKPKLDLLFWPGSPVDLARRQPVVHGANGQSAVTDEGRAWRVASGSDAHVYIDSAISGSVPATYLAVIRFNTLTGTTFSGISANNSGAVIVSQREVDADRSLTFCVSNNATSGSAVMGLWFGLDSVGNARGRKGGTAITTGRWYHVAGTFDPAVGFPNGCHVYVDGNLDDAATSNIGTATTFSGSRTRLGAHHLWPNTADDDADIEISYIARLPVALSASEIAKWHADPFGYVVEPLRRRIFAMLDVGGGAAELTSAASSQAESSGSITAAIPLLSAAASVTTASGDLTASIPLSAVAAMLSTGSGALTTQIKLSAASVVQALASAGLDLSTLFSGNVQAEAVTTGQLSTSILLSANALTQISASGAFESSSAALVGNAETQTSASANLSIQIKLSGAAIAESLLSGGLATTIPLATEALSRAVSAGQIQTTTHLAGGAANDVTASGDLTAPGDTSMYGQASGLTQTTGQLTTAILAGSAALALSSSSGSLTTLIPLSGASVALAAGGGDLTATIALSASVLAQALATGQLDSDAAELFSGATSEVQSLGELTTYIRLNTQALVQAYVAGQMTTGIPFSTLAKASSTATALLAGTGLGRVYNASIENVTPARTLERVH